MTPRSMTQGHPALERLREAGFEVMLAPAGRMPDGDFLRRELPGCIGYLAGVESIGARLLESARGLRIISRNGAGVSNIDLDACERLGIVVTRVDGGNAASVAELTIGLMLGLARRIGDADAALKTGRWERKTGIELNGKTLGIVGLGQIGLRVARISKAMGMRVIGFDPLVSDEVECVSMAVLLGRADVVTLHCPPSAEAVLRISEMKPGALLINTARWELLLESEILEALDSGHLAGYATDVLDGEPPLDWTLAKHPKILVTPHIGANTEAAANFCANRAVEDLLGVVKFK